MAVGASAAGATIGATQPFPLSTSVPLSSFVSIPAKMSRNLRVSSLYLLELHVVLGTRATGPSARRAIPRFLLLRPVELRVGSEQVAPLDIRRFE